MVVRYTLKPSSVAPRALFFSYSRSLCWRLTYRIGFLVMRRMPQESWWAWQWFCRLLKAILTCPWIWKVLVVISSFSSLLLPECDDSRSCLQALIASLLLAPESLAAAPVHMWRSETLAFCLSEGAGYWAKVPRFSKQMPACWAVSLNFQNWIYWSYPLPVFLKWFFFLESLALRWIRSYPELSFFIDSSVYL